MIRHEAQLTIVSSLKHHSTQSIYIFNRENPQNSESPNGSRRGLDFIALPLLTVITAYTGADETLASLIWPATAAASHSFAC